MTEYFSMNPKEARERATQKLRELTDPEDLQKYPPNTMGFEAEDVDFSPEQPPWWKRLADKQVTVVYQVQGVVLSGFDVVTKPIDPRVRPVPGHEPDNGVIRWTPFGIPMPGIVEKIRDHVRRGHRVILRDDMITNATYRKRMMEYLRKEGVPISKVELLDGNGAPASVVSVMRQFGYQALYHLRRRVAEYIMG